MTARSSGHAFIDESVRRNSGYIICAVTVGLGDLNDTRKVLRGLRLGGQSRLHMTKENSSRQKRLLSVVAQLPVTTRLFVVDDKVSDRRARDVCLFEIVSRLGDWGVTQLTIESCDQDTADVGVVRDALSKIDALDRVSYRHASPADEPLLWLPDMIAWAWGRGDDWRRRAGTMIQDVHQLKP